MFRQTVPLVLALGSQKAFALKLQANSELQSEAQFGFFTQIFTAVVEKVQEDFQQGQDLLEKIVEKTPLSDVVVQVNDVIDELEEQALEDLEQLNQAAEEQQAQHYQQANELLETVIQHAEEGKVVIEQTLENAATEISETLDPLVQQIEEAVVEGEDLLIEVVEVLQDGVQEGELETVITDTATYIEENITALIEEAENLNTEQGHEHNITICPEPEDMQGGFEDDGFEDEDPQVEEMQHADPEPVVDEPVADEPEVERPLPESPDNLEAPIEILKFLQMVLGQGVEDRQELIDRVFGALPTHEPTVIQMVDDMQGGISLLQEIVDLQLLLLQ